MKQKELRASPESQTNDVEVNEDSSVGTPRDPVTKEIIPQCESCGSIHHLAGSPDCEGTPKE